MDNSIVLFINFGKENWQFQLSDEFAIVFAWMYFCMLSAVTIPAVPI